MRLPRQPGRRIGAPRGTPPASDASPADDLCRSLYEREWTRRDQHQAAVSTPLALLTALAGALVYLYQQTLGAGDESALRWPVLFYAAFAGAAGSFVYATYALIRSFVGYIYDTIPFPRSLLEYRDGLRAHYASTRETNHQVADREFRAYLDDRFTEAAEWNAQANKVRGGWLHRTNVAMAAALACAVTAAGPVAVTLRARKPQPQQVEIVNAPRTLELKMADQPSQTPAPSTTTNQQPAPVVPKPVPPQNVKVRSGDVTPRPRTDSGVGGSRPPRR